MYFGRKGNDFMLRGCVSLGGSWLLTGGGPHFMELLLLYLLISGLANLKGDVFLMELGEGEGLGE